ncbi:MAG: methyltransferase domain-containing protein [Bryobacterales bacterium]|nr:methyltransferase domain-containing protein [Bryobacterales bacterium]
MEREILDGVPAAAAIGNLRDLARINRLLGGFASLKAGILALSGGAKDLRILDVAAGAGHAARWLERSLPGASVITTDLRPDLLAFGVGARVAADALALPFRDQSVDVVVSTLFLHHLEEAALAAAIAEMHRVSRRGVVAIDLARHPIAYRFLHWSSPLFRWHWITRVDGARSVQAAFTRKELATLLASAGFPEATVRMEHPWFRLSVRIPRGG